MLGGTPPTPPPLPIIIPFPPCVFQQEYWRYASNTDWGVAKQEPNATHLQRAVCRVHDVLQVLQRELLPGQVGRLVVAREVGQVNLQPLEAALP